MRRRRPLGAPPAGRRGPFRGGRWVWTSGPVRWPARVAPL